ncbi:MAG TPA: polyribonucleotide nucleotidyltransferase, partial [Candidatus Dormibacteraeota bacterium]|nr:polyribonucleotide nucleotidyltransferase [Candidatus Dormibacteraeota bacterium]
MTPEPQILEHHIGDKTISFEVGRVAEQANGAVVVKSGDTVLLVTATMSKSPRPGVDFLPLTCDYEEKIYAVGRIPGSFFRREARPGEQGILNSRLMDRPLRPLFQKDLRLDVQAVATVLSIDHEADPAAMAINGASAALSISDIPWAGPVGAVRIGLFDGKLVANPSVSKMGESDLDLIVAGTENAINMVEAGAHEVDEETIVKALELAHAEIKKICAAINELARHLGKEKKVIEGPVVDEELKSSVADVALAKIGNAIGSPDKQKRENDLDEIRQEVVAALAERFPDREHEVAAIFEKTVKTVVRNAIIDANRRPDGRKSDEIRPIWCQVGVLPRTHGSAIFTRGQTQALSVATLGSSGDAQKIDSLGLETSKRYMHHYNFPAFSVGEARPSRSPGRREIGHGALAERAVYQVLPDEKEYPYVIRVVTEILASNGSTSMASVCGSTLALMDAGVPIKAPVAGIAMGLVTRHGDASEGAEYAILSDIQGIEDALGDMDFKVAGTAAGITGLQMDIKVTGLSMEVMRKALAQAREGRLHILGKMAEVLAEPRKEMSIHAPRITTIKINPDNIRDVIGPGGKMIREITSECNVSIDVEDDGSINIASSDAANTEKAIAWIKGLTDDVEVGRVYKGKVVRLMPFGAFVSVLPKKDGLVHVSKLADWRVNNVEDFVKEGDEILVKVEEIDRQGRVNLSRVAALKDAAQWNLSEADEHFATPPVRPEPGSEQQFVPAGAGADRGPRRESGGGGGFSGGRDRERDDRPRNGGYGGGNAGGGNAGGGNAGGGAPDGGTSGGESNGEGAA